MGILLLAAFILVPLLEIAVFIQVGGLLGLWPTLGLIILTAVLGTWQLRAQGIAVLTRARDQMERGVMPARELFDGLCLLIAGGLLLTPGFITDSLGGLLFVPPFRDLLRRWISGYIASRAEVRFRSHGGPPGGSPSGPSNPGGGVGSGDGDGVIDGDYRDVTEPEEPPTENKKLPR